MFNRRVQRFIQLIWLLLVLLVEAEAKKRRRSARSRRYGDNPIGKYCMHDRFGDDASIWRWGQDREDNFIWYRYANWGTLQ